MNSNESLIKVAEDIQTLLKKNGFTIHRYNSYSSNSIYLKVDFGLAGSIRISDHVGKGYLNYTFNVGTDIKEYREEQGKYGVRYFIPENRLELLLPLVNKIYKSKITKYSKHWYNNKKEECEKKNIRELGKGFWSGAYRV